MGPFFYCDFALCPGHETSYVVCTAENQSATQARAFALGLAQGTGKTKALESDNLFDPLFGKKN